jgi:hypothetical protein
MVVANVYKEKVMNVYIYIYYIYMKVDRLSDMVLNIDN